MSEKLNYKQRLHTIKAFVFDIDGVLTDGGVLTFPGGVLHRTMFTKDGFALQYALKKGFYIGIISGGRDVSVADRLRGLGITDIYLASRNKLDDLEDFVFKYNLDYSEVLYMGDDIPDYFVMKKCGVATCPNDACSEIREISDYVSHFNGGKGCVRDIIEQTLKVQQKWFHGELDTPQSI